MSKQSTRIASRKLHRYPGGKQKRHLYLTDAAFQHLVDVGNANGCYPSEAAERIIRIHLVTTTLPEPLQPPTQLDLFDTSSFSSSSSPNHALPHS